MDDQRKRYTLREAAQLTGLSTEALRLRIRRGKLSAEKGNEGLRVLLTTADIETSVSNQERQRNPTDRTDKPNNLKALTDSVATLTDILQQDRTKLAVEMDELRQRARKAEDAVVAATATIAEVRLHEAVLKARLEAAEAALAEARRPFWQRWLGS